MSAPSGNTSTTSGYGPGTTLCIHEHLPPEPFTGAYGPGPKDPVDWSRWNVPAHKLDRVEIALAYPPIETEPPGKLERALSITGIKTIRDSPGAHVVTCFLDGDQSIEYVAKIYDGVHYPLGPRERGSIDCMAWADRDYSIEAWAYRTMQPELGGTVVPSYFGSWTFPVATGRKDQPHRWVRMILMEFVQGECLLDIILRAETEDKENPYGKKRIDYARLPPEPFRLRVLQNILEAHQSIWWLAAIKHEDLEPRNVMVKPDGSVVLIDFNNAFIYDFTAAWDDHPRKRDPTSLPPSPIKRYWPLPYGFASADGPWGDWIPEAWVADKELGVEWLVETYRGREEYERLPQWWVDWDRLGTFGERVLRLLESLGRETGYEGRFTPFWT